jgi:hypothetical protein
LLYTQHKCIHPLRRLGKRGTVTLKYIYLSINITSIGLISRIIGGAIEKVSLRADCGYSKMDYTLLFWETET